MWTLLSRLLLGGRRLPEFVPDPLGQGPSTADELAQNERPYDSDGDPDRKTGHGNNNSRHNSSLLVVSLYAW